MNIALIAHDNKKELMAQFCTAYCGILAQHTLCATATTGQIISDATGLTIHRFLSFSHGGGLPVQLFLSHEHGGSQQIGARIAYNEIDLVLCFDDPRNKTPNEDIANIYRLCDQNNIPYASNLASAEMLVLGLARGDLDWRNIVNPKTKPFTA